MINRRLTNKDTLSSTSPAFTIVELLVVIVIIGILAAITIVSYTGITQKAIIVSLTSDLDNASKQIKLYQTSNNSFPTILNTNNCPTAPVADNSLCLKPSPNNALTYSSNGSTFTLTETNANGTKYQITDSTTPTAVLPISLTAPTDCPSGFIPVPGSITYSQAGFCAMKYEAKQVGSTTTPISQANGLPWTYITQADATSDAHNVVGCTGCHLITEAEWMTIAQNVLGVASNWSTGTVGSGYIYNGNGDNSDGPSANKLAADSNDANGYAGEASIGGNQRRTLTLSNGQVIWDLAGNVWEWTSGTVAGGQPGVTGSGLGYREWPNVTNHGTLAINPLPSGTGIPGANGWNSNNGIGMIFSNSDDASLYDIIRGGDNSSGSQIDGVLALESASYSPSNMTMNTNIGFRVSR